MPIQWRWGEPGWGFSHTPLYIPNPRDEHDVASHIFGHTVTGAGLSLAARLYAGSWPAGGHLSQLYRALLSPAVLGSSRNIPPVTAWDDTMFALSVYSEPFRFVGRAMSKVAVPLAIADIAYQTYSDPSDNPITRGYEASPISLFFGDHLFQQHGFAGGMNQGLENVKKNLHLA